jgi:hypothetical protein
MLVIQTLQFAHIEFKTLQIILPDYTGPHKSEYQNAEALVSKH